MPVYCNHCGKTNKDDAKFCFSCGKKIESNILSDKTLSIGSFLENRYKILELIKKGGMGAVYKAHDMKLNCTCAVKELLPSFGNTEEQAQATEWFKRETSLLANLDHTNLPNVSDYFVTANNRYYLVMNFIEGEDLETKLEKEGKPGLPQDKVFEWATQLLIVLDYLHNQNPPIIYRDMKPANIMIHKDGRAMLIDFGIARTLQQDSTTQTIIGTLLYTPLEQLQGKAEPRSDLYALGATIHHLITGQEPVPLMGFESLRNYIPDINPVLDEVVMKAVTENLLERYSSANEMLEALAFKKDTFKNKLSLTGELDKKGLNDYSSNNSEEWNNRGNNLFHKGNFIDAVKCYNKALDLSPSYAEAWNNKAIALSNLKKFDEALICYERALEINSSYSKAWHNKGMTLTEMNNYREAISCYKRALEIEPDDIYLLNKLGNSLFHQGEIDGAIEIYNKAIELEPDNLKAWYNKANGLFRKGNHKEAIASYDRVLLINPDHAKALYNKGKALYMQGKYEEAVLCYDKVLKINPNFLKVYYEKGCALYYSGRHEEAILCYNKILEFVPDHVDAAHYKKSSIKLLEYEATSLVSSGKYEEALKQYDKILNISPDYVAGWVNKGCIFGTMGSSQEAIRCYDRALSLHPEDTEIWICKGLTFESQDKYEEAFRCYEEAMKWKPGDLNIKKDIDRVLKILKAGGN